MKWVLSLLLVFAVIHAAMFGVALGEGYLFHWLVPGLDFSTAVLMGLLLNLAMIFLVLAFFQMATALPGSALTTTSYQNEDEQHEEDEEEEVEEEETGGKLPRPTMGDFQFDWDQLAPRRRRKRKR